MEQLFNHSVFITGVFTSIILFSVNAANSLMCLLADIRIVRYNLFFSPFFSLHSKIANNTRFTLGWLPLGCYIEPIEMTINQEEFQQHQEFGKQVLFMEKPIWLKIMLQFNPMQFVVTIILFLMAFFLFIRYNNQHVDANTLFNYIKEIYNLLIFNNGDKAKFLKHSNMLLNGGNLTLFIVLVFLLNLVLLTPFNMLSIIFSSMKNKVLNLVSYVLTFFNCWIAFWKIPIFLLSIFTAIQCILFFLNYLIGAFLSGFILYFITFFLVKSRTHTT
jgi:hypothetical protein